MDRDQFKTILKDRGDGYGMWRNTAFFGYEGNNEDRWGAEKAREKLNALRTPGWSFSFKDAEELGTTGCILAIIADSPEILDKIVTFIGRTPLMLLSSELSPRTGITARLPDLSRGPG